MGTLPLPISAKSGKRPDTVGEPPGPKIVPRIRRCGRYRNLENLTQQLRLYRVEIGSPTVSARFFDRLNISAASPACVSNNLCQASVSPWLPLPRFFDIPL
jgi:hypothetical protein